METCTKNVFAIFAMVILSSFAFRHLQTNADNICGVNKEGLEICEPAVVLKSPKSPPSACCKALKKADLDCFCQYKEDTVLTSIIGIDIVRAMQLPSQCMLDDNFDR